jgi:hypothetical protein
MRMSENSFVRAEQVAEEDGTTHVPYGQANEIRGNADG